MPQIGAFPLGDMLARYESDDRGHVGLCLIPLSLKDRTLQKEWAVENLVQLHLRGDCLPHGYGNGMTLASSNSSERMTFRAQERLTDGILTTLSDGQGRVARHFLGWQADSRALRSRVTFENQTQAPLTLELLSSFSLGRISPFTPADAHGALLIHRARSCWSAEGRLSSQSSEELQLEPSWSRHALRVEKFGQIGSMPVRGYFPFAAVEDSRSAVTWAVQLACPSSWQIEFRRQDEGLCLTGGLADADYGHWAKTLAPGESFTTPEAYLTVAEGGVDAVSQRLLDIHRENWLRRDDSLPVIFNEYCTTWGVPSHENLAAIVNCLEGRGIDYLVIDAGWYRKEGRHWSDCGGDWMPDEKGLFPLGLKATADMIRSAGMKPGLWFEPETCAPGSDVFHHEAMLLHRLGHVIDTDNRRFMDMRQEDVQRYLDERVAGLLRDSDFSYIKVDYNDCIGLGCDDPDGLGEGLRQNMSGTLRFLGHLRELVPDVMIENCASGGHRLEPSFMGATDIASFSDAHECPEIPIIAANLHRLILPGQSQIWAVLRKTDSLRRLVYSLANTFLGVMCLSGDITELSLEQWRLTQEAIELFKRVSPIIRDGQSTFWGRIGESWRHPEGWQAIIRRAGRETLAVIHTFERPWPDAISLPVEADRVLSVFSSDQNSVVLDRGRIGVSLTAPFQAIVLHLVKESES